MATGPVEVVGSVEPSRPSMLGRVFGYASLTVKLALFALVFALAVKNSDPVTLRFFLGHEFATSLALALVGALCAGAAFGVLAMAAYAFRLRRELGRARAEAAALRERVNTLPSASAAAQRTGSDGP